MAWTQSSGCSPCLGCVELPMQPIVEPVDGRQRAADHLIHDERPSAADSLIQIPAEAKDAGAPQAEAFGALQAEGNEQADAAAADAAKTAEAGAGGTAEAAAAAKNVDPPQAAQVAGAAGDVTEVDRSSRRMVRHVKGLVYPTPPFKNVYTLAGAAAMVFTVLITISQPLYPRGVGFAAVWTNMLLVNLPTSLYFTWMVLASCGTDKPWAAWVLFVLFTIAALSAEYFIKMASVGFVGFSIVCVGVYACLCNPYACFLAAAVFGVVSVGFAGLRLLQNWGQIEGYIPSAVAPVFTVVSSVVLAGIFRLVPTFVWRFFAPDDIPAALMVIAMGNATAFTFTLRLSRMMAAPEGEVARTLAVSAVSIVAVGFVARSGLLVRVLRHVLRKRNLQDHAIYKLAVIDKVKDLTMRQSYVMSLTPAIFALPICAVAYLTGAPWARRASVWAAITYFASALTVDAILVFTQRRWFPVAGESVWGTFHRLATEAKQNWPDLQVPTSIAAPSWKNSAFSRPMPGMKDDPMAEIGITHLTMVYLLSGLTGVWGNCYIWALTDTCTLRGAGGA